MRYALLFIAVIAAGVVFGLYTLAATGAPELAGITRFTLLNTKAVGVLGGLIGLSLYSRGDYLRSAWGWLTVGSAMLFEADVVRVAIGPVVTPGTLDVLLAVILFVSNVATPLAIVLFARALSRAGLDLAGTPTGRAVFTIIAAIVALLVVGKGALADVRGLVEGDLSHLKWLFSDIGDVATLILVAPLVHNVLSLRGGALAWPYIMLSASGVAWLIDDAAIAAGGSGGAWPAIESCARIWALLFIFAAGLAQRWVMSAGARAGASGQRRAA